MTLKRLTNKVQVNVKFIGEKLVTGVVIIHIKVSFQPAIGPDNTFIINAIAS